MSNYSEPLVGPDQIKNLTGYERPGDQKRWLDLHGIKYATRKDGSLSTTWGLVEAGLMDSGISTEPDFEVLHGKAS